MAYTKQSWAAGAAGGTPLSPSRLEHIEDGIEAAHVTADAAVASPIDLADVPAGYRHTVFEVGGAYTRGTARADVVVVFVGTADPASVALENDVWDQLA